MNVATDLTDFDTLKAQVSLFVQPTANLVVVDSASNAVALGTLKTIKSFMNQIETRSKAATKPLKDRAKEISDYAKEITLPLESAETSIKAKMAAFAAEERKQREEEQRKIDAEIRERAHAHEMERQKIEAEARTSRLKADQARQAEEARQQKVLEDNQRHAAQARALFGTGPADKAKEAAAAKALADQQAQDRRVAEAQAEEARLSENARIERYQAEFTRSAAAARAKLEAERPKNMRQVPKYEVIDVKILPPQFLIADLVRIGSAVRAGTREIPGVRIWMEDTVVAR